MLAARRRFLEGGRFEPLSVLVNRLVGEALPPCARAGDGDPSCVVEVGCGTGHHLAGVRASLASPASPTWLGGPGGASACWFGFDVSKAACRLASSAHKTARFVVADLRQGLPLRDGRALAVLDVFAPRNAAEFRRIVHPEGLALVVIPGPEHLGELVRRFGLIHVHPGKEATLLGAFAREGFSLVHREGLRFGMELGPVEIADLVRMGPSARHLAPGRLDDEVRTMGAAGGFATASFVLLLLRPGPGRAQPGVRSSGAQT
jgi:SAM-dependent methyltransferase